MTLHSAWISEFAELDYLNTKRQAGEVKAFLSQSSDIFRVPYGKVTETFPRRGIIVGSTNRHDGFLLDDTGSRRFWVIETSCTMDKPIQSQEIKKIRDKLDKNKLHDVQILSYAVKFASSFYGPFRDAVGSSKSLKGNKKTYQMDFRNKNESKKEHKFF